MRADGLTLKTLTEGDVHLKVRATDDPREIGPVDLVLFCVKTYDVVVAAHHAVPLVGAGTLILPPQNGVEAADQIAAVLGKGPVLGCAAVAGGTLVAPASSRRRCGASTSGSESSTAAPIGGPTTCATSCVTACSGGASRPKSARTCAGRSGRSSCSPASRSGSCR